MIGGRARSARVPAKRLRALFPVRRPRRTGLCYALLAQIKVSKAMDPFEVFTARDLRLRSGAFLKNSEEGHLALVTKHGRPSILAVPFTERLLELGLHRTLALHLFENRYLTLARAAKLAAMSVEEFVHLLGQAGIPAADYPPEELDEELRAAS